MEENVWWAEEGHTWILEAPTFQGYIEDKASSKENKTEIVAKTESGSVQWSVTKTRKERQVW